MPAPYLSTPNGKIVEAFSLGLYKSQNIARSRELIEISVLVAGRVAARVGPVSYHSLRNHFSTHHPFRRKGEKVSGKFTVTRSVRGFPYSSSVPFRVNFITLPNGRMKFSLNGSVLAASGSMKLVRTRVRAMRKAVRSVGSRSARNSPARPSPEIWQQQFFRVLQTSAGLNSQTVVPIPSTTRIWSGVRTPGYGKLKSRALPDNPHTVDLTIWNRNRYCWNQVQPATGAYDFRLRPWTELITPHQPPGHLTEADTNALRRLVSNANSGINANLAQNIAQVSQLSNLIIGNASKIGKALWQLKRGNLTGAASTLTAGQQSTKWNGPKGKLSTAKGVASNWLQLQYGWKPLLSDIQGLFTSLGNLQSPNDSVQSASSSATVRKEFVEAWPPGVGPAGDIPGVTKHLVSTTTKYRIRYKVSSPYTAFLAQTGFTNPINLFWEILPFSFVVDWFLPIGNYLESFSAWDGLTFLGGSKVQFTRTKTDSTISYHGLATGNPSVRIDWEAEVSFDKVLLGRGPLSSFPNPVQPSFNSSGLQPGVRAANAVALLVQAFR